MVSDRQALGAKILDPARQIGMQCPAKGADFDEIARRSHPVKAFSG
jgi:hypothetical protein